METIQERPRFRIADKVCEWERRGRFRMRCMTADRTMPEGAAGAGTAKAID
jgi:hypothetical protein